jgi:hypothetical protein
MLNTNSTPVTTTTKLNSPSSRDLQEYTTLELAQALAQRLAISEKDWHRLKTNRQARALEQTAAALVFLIKAQPTEAIARLQQAISWLDRSISAPPCPTHGDRNSK